MASHFFFIFALSFIILLGLSQFPTPSYCFDDINTIVNGGDGDAADFDFDDSDLMLFHQDYSPPSPPPPPPHPPSVKCEADLGGVGSLDTTCKIVSDMNITKNVYIQGKGNFYILPNITVNCSFSGCELTINMSGNFYLGENSTIFAGALILAAGNVTFRNGSVVNTTGLAGDPPPQTSGTPQGAEGSGGGYGGRGAGCLMDEKKLPEDVWGGDAYGWAALEEPSSYGSRGGTTSKEVDYGGGGGGRITLTVDKLLEVNGSLLADGGDGGTKGGGGSGGSIFIKASKMLVLFAVTSTHFNVGKCYQRNRIHRLLQMMEASRQLLIF